MQYRFFTEDDYAMICSWWESWKWQPIPITSLPKTGIIVSNGGVDVCAAFLYKSDSAICWLEWFISNPQAKREQRKGSIEYLIDVSADVAREYGFSMILCSLKHENLMRKVEDAGFVRTETGMTNFIGVV